MGARPTRVMRSLPLRDTQRVAAKKLHRAGLHLRLALASEATRREAFRCARGQEDRKRLCGADRVVVSIGKSGRTWLRVMLSRLYQQLYQLPEHEVINFDNFHRLDSRVPRIFFTHDDFLRYVDEGGRSKRDYSHKPLLLLVRDPRDVAVSQYFHWRYRMKPWNMWLLGYPPPGTALSIHEFVMGSSGRLRPVIRDLNAWVDARQQPDQLSMIRYEDLREDPAHELTRVVTALGIPAEPAQIEEAVHYARYDNMKTMEANRTLGGGRVRPRSVADENTYKVRRAKVGGYRDYFSEAELAAIDALVRAELHPDFGY